MVVLQDVSKAVKVYLWNYFMKTLSLILDVSDQIQPDNDLHLSIIPSIEREFLIWQSTQVVYSLENESRYGKIKEIKTKNPCNLSNVQLIRSNNMGKIVLQDNGNRLILINKNDKQCIRLDPIFSETKNLTLFTLLDQFYSIEKDYYVSYVY